MSDILVEERAIVRGKGWTVKVEVKAEPGPPPDYVSFSMDPDSKVKNPQDPQELVFSKDKDGMKKADYYLVEFDLDDSSGLNLEFAPNPMQAFWVDMGSGSNPNPQCPTSPSYSEEVYAVSVKGDELTVCNEDSYIAKFCFSLGFLKGGADPKDPNSYVRYDPGGDNRNGGS